ncbi:hypothetical protein K7432_016871 [Basidiobolus ranarum]|uniref:Uncharacterized protein n=1 Tax=Basidiobolus ranarum TaxID=34480 RepID=A0ABR2VLA7_9FUNG
MKFNLSIALIAASLLSINAAPVDTAFGQLSDTCKQSLLSIVTGNEPCLPFSQIWSQASSIDW